MARDRETLNVDGAVLGARIKRLRLNRGISQRQLGAAIGRPKQTVSGWENGLHVPGSYVIHRIAEAFGVPYEVLLPKREEPTNANQ